MKFNRFFAGLVLIALGCSSAHAQLFFSEDSNGNGLYTLDVNTGAATNVGISGVTSSTVGLAPSDISSELFATQFAQLLRVAVDGSGATAVGGDGQEALAYDPGTGTLYGGINGSFRTIDPLTGNNLTSLADPGVDMEGLAWGDGGVYGIAGSGQSNLYFYNPGTDSWSVVGDTAVNWDDAGLAFDPGSRTLYGKGDQDSNLYSIDPDTGASTLIGDTGIAEGGGLAFAGQSPLGPTGAPIAIPATSAGSLMLLLLIMFILGWLATRAGIHKA